MFALLSCLPKCQRPVLDQLGRLFMEVSAPSFRPVIEQSTAVKVEKSPFASAVGALEGSLDNFETSVADYLSGKGSILEVNLRLKSAKLALDLAAELRKQLLVFVERVLNVQA